MTDTSQELVLLERVFFRLGSADTDEQLEKVLATFLTPVLLKLSSPQEKVRQKVMELLIHVNKRVKSRPLVQLPVEALLEQYADSSMTAFVINFNIIYLKLGFPRLPIKRQIELIPNILNSLNNRPQTHIDSLLLLILPLLGQVTVPRDPARVSSVFGLHEKLALSKHLLEIFLDVMLLPYGACSLLSSDSATTSRNTETHISVPPSMSENSYKRLASNNIKPNELEDMKNGIVKFLSHGIFKNEDALIPLIVAAADTRFSVANAADSELKKIVGAIDWSLGSVTNPLYQLFLGSQPNSLPANQAKSPSCTRISLKLVFYLCKATGNGFIFPACIQVIFGSLFGPNTNSKLKTLALNFSNNIINEAEEKHLKTVSPLLLTGLKKVINEGEEIHQGKAYILIGLLGQRFPELVFHNVSLLEMYLESLEKASPDLKLQIREGLLSLVVAYKAEVFPSETDKDGRLSIIYALIKNRIYSEESILRFVCVRMLAAIFPLSHVPSTLLLIQNTIDAKDEVSSEALKALYGTARKTDFDLSNKDRIELTKVKLPQFSDIVIFVKEEAEANMADSSKRYSVGGQIMPYPTLVFTEIIIYLRLCLLQDLDVPLTRNIAIHPCEYTVTVKNFLTTKFKDDEKFRQALVEYVKLNKQLLLITAAIEPFRCLVEVLGCVEDLHPEMELNKIWVRDHLNATNEEVREAVAVLYAILIRTTSDPEFNESIQYLISQTSTKTLENQHGALLAIGYCLEYRTSKVESKNQLQSLIMLVINLLDGFLKHLNQSIVGAACLSIGLLGKCGPLPIKDGSETMNESPKAKRPTSENITKLDLVQHLLDIMNDKKYTVKVKERAAKALGLLCVGEQFPHTKVILQGFLNNVTETKDVEVHFTIGESLVLCCQSIWSSEARDEWSLSAEDFVPNTTEPVPDTNLEWLLENLLKLVQSTHPNSRQACSIWLLAIVKSCGKRNPITKRLKEVQNTFMDLLAENNDIIQDVASKGLCVVYDTYKSEELLESLVKQLASGTKNVSQVSKETKIFEEGQLGKTPTGGNLTTYKELCSLASDLNKPDLIYQFMQIANHNTIWNSKKGAAYGFSSIAEKCGKDLQSYLPQIVPKLYRYQFDPAPNTQQSMHNIWRTLVKEPQKVVEQYFNEILEDLLENINSNQYRVRQSCCLALEDLLKGSGNKSVHDCLDKMNELWTKLFRVMDDHHEETRLVAIKTTKVLSKLCVRACDVSQGKDGTKMVAAILPPLLDIGITNSVAEIRHVSLKTISELINSAGNQLKPFLPRIIPALLQATGELESSKLSYLSNVFGAQSQAQEAIDSARATFAKSHFTTETVSKSLQYADDTILEELMPKIIELMKTSVGLGTKIATAHFITLLVIQMDKNNIQPYTGKLLAVLVNGLLDRNTAVRKHYANAIGHIVRSAKESSIEKLFLKLEQWYFDKEDDSVRSAIAATIQSIGTHNQDILKSNSKVVLPLVFFAMHMEKTPETENTFTVWTDIWSEHSPGTETGISQNITSICNLIKKALESPSWTLKAQGANTIVTVANKLGSSLEHEHQTFMIGLLLSSLSGRTWNGKEKLLKALSSICSNCKENIKQNSEFNIKDIEEAILRECKKENVQYKIQALSSLGDIIASLESDRFDEIYEIIQTTLVCDQQKSEENTNNDDVSSIRENNIKLKEAAYETLGKVWPANGKDTQRKYGEIFVKHCASCLPITPRNVQVSVMTALYNFVDKLIILNEGMLEVKDEEMLDRILDDIVTANRYALGIPKFTKLRKESLNVIYCLSTKLKKCNKEKEFLKVQRLFEEFANNLEADRQPEIRSRIKDIKELFKT